MDKHQIACKAAIEVANNHLLNVDYVDSDDDFISDDDSVYGSNNRRRRMYSEKDVSRFFDGYVDQVFQIGFMTKQLGNFCFCPCACKNQKLFLEKPILIDEEFQCTNKKSLKPISLM